MTKSRLSGYRTRRDEYFATDEHSPLSDGDRLVFKGLAYFDERPDLAFQLEIDERGDDVGERIELPTANNAVKQFIRAGRVHFEVDGQPAKLTVFKDVERGRFFLPFKDATAGKETYSVGRYLDPQKRPDGKLVVDFNYAYNPYCAYSHGWSCPLTPFENILPIRIEAGEKIPPVEHK
jgi:uncharacterized protein (DUF1684 family)